MKNLTSLFAFSLMFNAFTTLAHADEKDACAPVFEACEAKGFTKDDQAPTGKKIWGDCANLIINEGKTVPSVNVTPKVATQCKKFKTAKDQFVKGWNEKHKND